MLQIFPRECTADPDRIRLGETTVIRFSARSSKTAGEQAVVSYEVGNHADVVIDGDTDFERHVGQGNTEIGQTLRLVARNGGSPCGDLTVRVSLRRAGRVNPDDRISTQFRISCD